MATTGNRRPSRIRAGRSGRNSSNQLNMASNVHPSRRRGNAAGFTRRANPALPAALARSNRPGARAGAGPPLPAAEAVHDWRCVEPDVARFGQARRGAAAFDHFRQLSFRNPAQPVRTRRDPQRGIALGHRIKMDAHRTYRFDQREGRLHVEQPLLHRPGTEAGRLDSFPHGNGAALIPAERPVGARALVEQDRADRAPAGDQCAERIAAEQLGESRRARPAGAPQASATQQEKGRPHREGAPPHLHSAKAPRIRASRSAPARF